MEITFNAHMFTFCRPAMLLGLNRKGPANSKMRLFIYKYDVACTPHARLNMPYRFPLEKLNKTLTPEELRAKNKHIKKQFVEHHAKKAAERQSN